MTFDERMARVKAWMKSDVLTRFSPPRGVDPAIAAKDVAEAVNRSIAGHLGPDAFDAMLSSRTYRKGLGIDEAIRRLRDSSPDQFDPQIVAPFIELAVSDHREIAKLEESAA